MSTAAEASGAVTSHKDFFISYNRADRAWAEWIAWQLEEAKFTTVLQAWDFRPGGNFVLDMQRAAAQAERTIAVLSADFLASAFTQPEWAAAFAQDPTGQNGLLVPVRVQACNPQGLLRAITYIDLVGVLGAGDEVAARDTLLAGVQRGRRKPASAPPFPFGTKAPRSVPERPRFPGALPPIWNVPHLRNPNFTGREDLLEQLQTALTPGQPMVLTGLGGVGKSQLAAEYIYRNAGEYDVVWWVRAEEPATLASDYAGLARELARTRGSEKQDLAWTAPDEAVIKAITPWLHENTRWLLVFDNAPEVALVRPYLPQGGGGHVLITSRHPASGGLAQPLPVKPPPHQEAVAFLLARTGQTDERSASELATVLGELPLALEQAAAYMEMTSRSLAEYLKLFRNEELAMLDRGGDETATVATTWELAFQQVQAMTTGGADLLNVCAFLAPEAILLDVIKNGSKHLPDQLHAAAANELAWDDAVIPLRRYSLIETGAGSITLHRLVQAAARSRMSEEARKTYAGMALRCIEASFPSNSYEDVKSWQACSRLLPHALAAAEYAEALEVSLNKTADLLGRVGQYFRGRGQWRDSMETYGRQSAIRQAQARPDRRSDLINYGYVLLRLGEFVEARARFAQALRLAEERRDSDDPAVAEAAHGLGQAFWRLGDLPQARSLVERALSIDTAAYGREHARVARDLNILGNVLRDQGDLVGARNYCEEALRIDMVVLGSNHRNVARDLVSLANVLRDQGDRVETCALLKQALEINRAALDDNHPDTLAVQDLLRNLDC